MELFRMQRGDAFGEVLSIANGRKITNRKSGEICRY